MRIARNGVIGLVMAAGAIALSTADATAQIKGPVPVAPIQTALPGSNKVVLPKMAPVLQRPGTCGVAQVQCYLLGGKVPSTLPADSADNVRPKVCASTTDPTFGCGTCARCILFHTVGAFCGPSGCDYKSCEKNWADEDGDRKNGCEQYRIKALVPPATALNMGNQPCVTDATCGWDYRCRSSGGLGAKTCQSFRCAKQDDCAYLGPNDGLFANGYGECKPTAAGADRHGCIFTSPQCAPFQFPSEGSRSCQIDRSITDIDRDGFDSIQFGGGDCDDGDNNRFPGNTEVCDAFNHDEDCDPTTHGGADSDKDGLKDAACCNLLPNGRKSCGTDCDDKNGALALSGMRCTPDGQAQVCVIDKPADGGQTAAWQTRPCPSGTRCIAQPNGIGVCH